MPLGYALRYLFLKRGKKMKIVIVGGVAGGASAAARLRRLDEHAEIVLLERGEFVSFANCGLPYYIGGVIQKKRDLTLQTKEGFKARFNVDVRVCHEVVEILPNAKILKVKNRKTEEIYEEHYDTLILSPGAEPIRPNLVGSDLKHVFTLRSIPDTIQIKNYIEAEHVQEVAVIGGGYIGVEMAENLHSLGLKVSIVELADHLIAPLDYDMAAEVQQYIQKKGIQLFLNNGVVAIKEDEILLEKGQLKADMVLLSIGVRPETSLAKACGIKTNARGSILVDAHMRTNFADIYAVGDAVEVNHFVTKTPAFIPLAGPANKQGRIAADVIAGYPSKYVGTQGSAILKLFDMTIATTGLNEKAAEAAKIEYEKTYLYSAPHATYYPGGRGMSIKVLWEKKTLQILGAQIVGYEGVDKRMDILATAMRLSAKITDLTSLELCYAPPFGSAKDPINMIGFVAENIITGKLHQFFWHDIERLPKDGSITLLDVRTKEEREQGTIAGFASIPLDSLREHLDEIPKDRPVFIHCHSGLRSYIACRILAGYGYTCYSLAGGYRLYDLVVHQN